MGNRASSETGRPPARSLLSLAAGLVVLILLIRGLAGAAIAPVTSDAVPAPRSQAETLLGTVVGAGEARVFTGSAPQSTLVLLNSDHPAADSLTAADVASLLAEAGLYAPLNGDKLTVRHIAFATEPDAFGPLAFLEFGGLALVAALLAAAALTASSEPQPVQRRSAQTEPADIVSPPSLRQPFLDTPIRQAAIDAVHREPAAAAAVIRHWLARPEAIS